MCMQFTLDKIPSKIFVFTTAYFFLLFNVEKLQIHGVTLVWRSRPFTIHCAGWNHAIHRHSSIPATLEYHYRNRRNAATGDNSMYCMIPDPFIPSSAFGKGSATPD